VTAFSPQHLHDTLDRTTLDKLETRPAHPIYVRVARLQPLQPLQDFNTTPVAKQSDPQRPVGGSIRLLLRTGPYSSVSVLVYIIIFDYQTTFV
jgi:hypothetical protein